MEANAGDCFHKAPFHASSRLTWRIRDSPITPPNHVVSVQVFLDRDSKAYVLCHNLSC